MGDDYKEGPTIQRRSVGGRTEVCVYKYFFSHYVVDNYDCAGTVEGVKTAAYGLPFTQSYVKTITIWRRGAL
jgi:hypothetical protein